MFDISWSHLLIFALAAIILVPSKDLPALLRTIGRYVGDARKMAREFRGQVDEALRETEFTDLQKSVKDDLRSIEKSASMAETERSLNAALNASPTATAAVGQPTGQIIPSVSTTLPVHEEVGGTTLAAPVELAAAVMAVAPARELASGPVAGASNGGRPHNDGIEVVRAGRGSVAQRAAAAWKKTAGSESGG